MNYYIPNSRSGIGVDRELKLSAPESFRLFSQGVQALATYERTSLVRFLDSALESLAACVAKYPADLLPKFYLGVAQSLRGYAGLDPARENLKQVINSGNKSLRRTARYNLAAAYVEAYSNEMFGKAEKLLKELIGELRSESQADRPLLFQSWALLLYIRIHRDLWKRTKKAATWEQLQGDFSAIERELFQFEREFTGSPSSQLGGANETWADYWNDRGIFNESLGRAFAGDESKSKENAAKAMQAYDRALAMKPNWPPARANIGVVYCDLLGDDASGERIFSDLAINSSQQEYANYYLGQIAERRKRWQEAVGFYRKAGWIPEAAVSAARVLETQLNNRTAALELLESFEAKYGKLLKDES